MALALKRAGASHLFTLNGAHIWPLLRGAAAEGIRVVDVRHEQTAAFAAQAWSKLTRTCGVAAATAGPGVTNAVSALAGADSDGAPMLLVGGRAPNHRWGMGSLQELDHLPIVAGITRAALTLQSPEDAYRVTSEAVRTALSNPTGPTFIDVPFDVFFATGERPEAVEHLVPDPGLSPDPDALAEIARALAAAERPAVIAGGGVWWARAEEELVRLLERARLPVVVNGMARGLLPRSHPLLATRARSTALGTADCVLVAGAELDFRFKFGQAPAIAEGARVLRLEGDLKRALAGLEALLPEAGAGRQAWVDQVAEAVAAARAKDEAVAASDSTPIHPARLIREVERFCDPDAVMCGDGGDFVSFAGRLLERDRLGLWLDAGPFGCLGAGPGLAMAAKLAHPERQVVLFSGDGAFGFSGLEFEALVRQRIPVVCVIGNNGVWALEKQPMERLFGSSIAADLTPGARYDKVVEALGGHGELVERPDQVAPALERAFKSGLPACLNVLTDPAAEYPRGAALI